MTTKKKQSEMILILICRGKNHVIILMLILKLRAYIQFCGGEWHGDWRRTRRPQIPWSSTHPASSTSSAILLMLTPQLNWIESWKNLYICREREGWRRIREWRESICLVHPIILSSFSLPPLPSAAATTSTHVGTTASHKHLHAYRSTTSHSISL